MQKNWSDLELTTTHEPIYVAVYFLTETQAPFHYAKLEEDIMFRVDALGVPTLLSDACNGRLEEQADCYVYTLSVPNTKIPLVSHILSIRKEVDGSFGDREREFEFTITIENAEESDGFEWALNGDVQPLMPATGGKFKMKHGDHVELLLPDGVDVTLQEQNGAYRTTILRNEAETVDGNCIQFTFTDSTSLLVRNMLDGIIPTDASANTSRALALILFPVITFGIVLLRKRKNKLILPQRLSHDR